MNAHANTHPRTHARMHAHTHAQFGCTNVEGIVDLFVKQHYLHKEKDTNQDGQQVTRTCVCRARTHTHTHTLKHPHCTASTQLVLMRTDKHLRTNIQANIHARARAHTVLGCGARTAIVPRSWAEAGTKTRVHPDVHIVDVKKVCAYPIPLPQISPKKILFPPTHVMRKNTLTHYTNHTQTPAHTLTHTPGHSI